MSVFEWEIRDITPELKIVKDKDWNYWTNPSHMYSISDGNVGIGTTTPQSALHRYCKQCGIYQGRC